MFATTHIHAVETDIPGLHAFAVTGEVARDDMTALAAHMNEVFDRADKVDMALFFRTDETATAGAGLSLENIEAQVRSLFNIRNYVVANAPGAAGGLVETLGKLMPVEAQAFDTEAEALDWLRAQPAP